METIDNRASLTELDEIYKYKNLIELSDKDALSIPCRAQYAVKFAPTMLE